MIYRKSASGLTLIELIVVLGVVSVVVFWGILSLGSFLSQSRLKNSAEDVASTLRWARRLSITKRREYRVVFEPVRRKYWIEDEEGMVIEGKHLLLENVIFADPGLWKKEEEDGIVEFDDPDDDNFSFYPRGTAETGSVYLKNKDSGKWYTITISSTTGYIRVYPKKH
jgi:prepilin-type N-terminal cleavage/methylation domain-containing protein